MSDIITETDVEMKKLPVNDRTRVFWEIITGQRPPGKLDAAITHIRENWPPPAAEDENQR